MAFNIFKTLPQNPHKLPSFYNLSTVFYSKRAQREEEIPKECSKNLCPKPKKKKSLWKRLFSNEDKPLPKPPPDASCCKKRFKEETVCPDLSEFGGQPYQTCGDAFLIQKDLVTYDAEREPSIEELQLRKIEADPCLKDTINEDPLGKFESTEIRLLQMTDLKLHPLYKKFEGIKRKYIKDKKKDLYKTLSWPIDMHEIPARVNINAEIVEKKNMECVEFKRIEPPRDIVQKLVELGDDNTAIVRPTYRCVRHVPVDLREVERRVKMDNSTAAYETLHCQKGTKY